MAVTDHDTTAAFAEAREASRSHGIDVVSGIEVTATEDGRDIHILGYFVDPDDPRLQAFLDVQRARRLARVEEIATRLAALGMPVDVEPILARARLDNGKSVGRPLIARAMVDAGHVADTSEAFDRWLGRGCPAFVQRDGPSPREVIDVIHGAAGIASLAHPGKLGLDSRMPSLVDEGLDAVEVFHPDHVDGLVDHYVGLARDMNLLQTGGSDFHGDPTHGAGPGSVTLPDAEWARLRDARRGPSQLRRGPSRSA
jgi:predicted metal-dependent phosphoesterase TrpH